MVGQDALGARRDLQAFQDFLLVIQRVLLGHIPLGFHGQFIIGHGILPSFPFPSPFAIGDLKKILIQLMRITAGKEVFHPSLDSAWAGFRVRGMGSRGLIGQMQMDPAFIPFHQLLVGPESINGDKGDQLRSGKTILFFQNRLGLIKEIVHAEIMLGADQKA